MGMKPGTLDFNKGPRVSESLKSIPEYVMFHFYLTHNSPGSVKWTQMKPHIPVSPLCSGEWEILRSPPKWREL